MPDQDGCPSEHDLDELATWSAEDPRGWMERARALWYYQEWGWPELDCQEVSTAGWSGNESIMGAMRQNPMWSTVFVSGRAGGHYTFKIPPLDPNAPAVLPPCPFCGGAPRRDRMLRDGYLGKEDDQGAWAYVVSCRNCQATGGWSKVASNADWLWRLRHGGEK